MIYQLKNPRGLNTHVRVTSVQWAPGSGAVVYLRPGRIVNVPAVMGPDPDWTPVEGEEAPLVELEPARSEFRPDRLLGEIRRQVTKREMQNVGARAARAGAPREFGEQVWRLSDLLPEVEGDVEGEAAA